MSHLLLKKRDKMYDTFSRDIVGPIGIDVKVVKCLWHFQILPKIWQNLAKF